MQRFLTQISKYYSSCAVAFLNLSFVLLIANGLAYILIAARWHVIEPVLREPVRASIGEDQIDDIFRRPSKQVDELMHETWERALIYEPFAQFREAPFVGKWVNVDQTGFRLSTNQGPWPPQPDHLNVFFFGGSTTFNYGVADNETIASNLQRLLQKRYKRPVSIYNFGQGYYYSSQERILFEKMLMKGHVPHVVLFMDGLNDFAHQVDEPHFTLKLSDCIAGRQEQKSWFQTVFGDYSLVRLLRSVRERLAIFSQRQTASLVGSCPETKYDDTDRLTNVITRYHRNKVLTETIARGYGINATFIWQPVPTYKYDLKYHRFLKENCGDFMWAKFGYPLMERSMKGKPMGRNFIWLADIQENRKENLYVDRMHYSPAFSQVIAQRIDEELSRRQLLPP